MLIGDSGMKFDPLRYLKEYSIPHYIGGKNVGVGWVGVACPLCGDMSSHGGFNIEGGYYSCWHCGKVNIPWIIKHLENIPYAEAKKRFEEYKTHSPTQLGKRYADFSPKSDIQFPTGTSSIKDPHKRYLQSRGFDPDEIVEKYHILGTGPVAFVKIKDDKGNEFKINYSNRIIIPIIYQNKVVSYQGRDITSKAELRYRTCPLSEEVMPNKHILYNLDNCDETIVIMEGALDTWKWGDGAASTFGIQWKDEQLLCLLDFGVKRAVVMYDWEPQAQKQAKKLVSTLKLFGISAKNYNLGDKDPAELSEKEIWKIKLELRL